MSKVTTPPVGQTPENPKPRKTGTTKKTASTAKSNKTGTGAAAKARTTASTSSAKMNSVFSAQEVENFNKLYAEYQSNIQTAFNNLNKAAEPATSALPTNVATKAAESAKSAQKKILALPPHVETPIGGGAVEPSATSAQKRILALPPHDADAEFRILSQNEYEREIARYDEFYRKLDAEKANAAKSEIAANKGTKGFFGKLKGRLAKGLEAGKAYYNKIPKAGKYGLLAMLAAAGVTLGAILLSKDSDDKLEETIADNTTVNEETAENPETPANDEAPATPETPEAPVTPVVEPPKTEEPEKPEKPEEPEKSEETEEPEEQETPAQPVVEAPKTEVTEEPAKSEKHKTRPLDNFRSQKPQRKANYHTKRAIKLEHKAETKQALQEIYEDRAASMPQDRPLQRIRRNRAIRRARWNEVRAARAESKAAAHREIAEMYSQQAS